MSVQRIMIGATALTVAVRVGAQEPLTHPIQLASADRGPLFYTESRPGAARVDAHDAAVLRRRVTLDVTDVPLATALATITRQTGLRIGMPDGTAAPGGLISIHVREITVAGALADLLLDANLDVRLDPGGRSATLVPRVATLTPMKRRQASGTITGRVTEAATHGAMGQVAVRVEGTNLGAVTTSDGRYTVASVPLGTYRVVARRVGYTPLTKTVTITGDAGAQLDFVLALSPVPLDQVVVTGTVVATAERQIPNPITVINSTLIQEQRITNLDQLFRGIVPGVLALHRGQQDEDGSTTVSVRGTSSLDNDNNAIKTYIDGIEMADSHYLTSLDPESIDHIEIVRGPQASTIYGSGAINGVMQIFTKKGVAGLGHPRITAAVSTSILQSTYTNSAPGDDADIGVDGGGDNFSYHAGGAYHFEGAWQPYLRAERETFNGAVHRTEGPVSLDATARVTGGSYISSPFSLYSASRILDGQYQYSAFSMTPAPTSTSYPQQTLGVTASYVTTPGWRQTLTVGQDNGGDDRLFGPGSNFRSLGPAYTSPSDSLIQYLGHGTAKRASAAYNTTFTGTAGALTGTLTAGADYWQYNFDSYFAYGNPLTVGSLTPQFSFITRISDHNAGYFTQGQVGIADALFLTGGLRAEQNPDFGAHHGLDYSPRVGVAYNQDLGPVAVKVRASYGRATRPPAPREQEGFETNSFGTTSVQFANPGLRPESQLGGDGGVDFYYKNRTSVSVTYYRQMVHDLIANIFLLDTPTLLQSEYENIGRVENTGWELQWGTPLVGPLTLSGTYSVIVSTVRQIAPGDPSHYAVGDRLLGFPDHTGLLSLGYARRRLVLNGTLSYEGPVLAPDYAGRSDQGSARLNPQFIDYSKRPPIVKFGELHYFGVRGAYDITRQLNLFTKVDNVGNNTHTAGSEGRSAPLMGRVTTLGVRWTR